MKETFIEPTLFDILKKQFKNHHCLPGNHRTIFSGKFGSGKTTFLEHFFKDEISTFIPITLYPVNYSIATNQDIFTYIKYDLFLEILPHIDLANLDTADLKLPEKIFLYWKNGAPDILENCVALIGALGKAMHPALETIEKVVSLGLKLKQNIDEYAEKVSKQYDQHRALYELIEQVKGKSSSLYEETIITALLEKAIGDLKTENKKVVVIIEDLDRIDPEHIFRILNVFSAHFDSKTTKGENSFGIDVLTVVCDEENIRNIFSNRYGSNVDYSGYIDKFYFHSIFHFSYTDLAHDYIRKQIQKVTLSVGDNRQPSDLLTNTVLGDSFLEYALAVLFDNKMINLRSINRVLHKEIRFVSKDLKLGTSVVSLLHHLIIFEVLILTEVCGGVSSTRKSIQALANIKDNYHKRGRVFERIIALLCEANGSKRGENASIRIGEISYSGNLSLDPNEQNYVSEMVILGQFGTAGIDALTTYHLFAAIDQVLAVIERYPRLRLYTYYEN